MNTLGSLFDGSGGFPLAGALNGITPVWASEIEPYPIAVTRSRFPSMKHLGSVTEINGSEIDPVDIITFGSPCQDLSVAGKRAGIHEGTRSSLFFQATRIIREMREATNGKYPAFAIWENVPGAFSSNRGEDFRCVLEQITKIRWGGKYTIPRPTGGRWAAAGEIVADGFSVAWRLLDAQYWGVPQRRKRIYLVADFRDESAGKILFESESLPRNPKTSRATWEGAAGDTARSTGGSSKLKCLNGWDYQAKRIYEVDGAYPTISAREHGGQNDQAVIYALDSMNSNSMKSANPNSGFHAENVSKTLQASGVDPSCNQGGNVIVQLYPCLARTLAARADSSPCVDRGQNFVCYALQGNGIDRADTAGCNGCGWREGESYTLNTIDRQAVCYNALKPLPTAGLSSTLPASEGCAGTGHTCALRSSATAICEAQECASRKYIVRRITPTECARLQGFPDCWGHPDIKQELTDEEMAFWENVRSVYAEANGRTYKPMQRDTLLKWYNNLHTDSNEYKMWGNGIALPCAAFVLGGIAAELREETR